MWMLGFLKASLRMACFESEMLWALLDWRILKYRCVWIGSQDFHINICNSFLNVFIVIFVFSLLAGVMNCWVLAQICQGTDDGLVAPWFILATKMLTAFNENRGNIVVTRWFWFDQKYWEKRQFEKHCSAFFNSLWVVQYSFRRTLLNKEQMNITCHVAKYTWKIAQLPEGTSWNPQWSFVNCLSGLTNIV